MPTNSAAFTALERKLLTRVQWDFPICPEPYVALARELGAGPDEVRQVIAGLRQSGVIRRIGGSFVPRKLGYISVLVAGRVAADRLVAAAEHAAAFPGVTHNYERESVYNLWFTVIAEDQARLDAILAAVRSCPGVEALHALPALKTFKIRVRFDLDEPAVGGQPEPLQPDRVTAPGAVPDDPPLVLDDVDRRLIPRCCGDVGLEERPFRAMAAELQLTEGELLRRLALYKDTGALRRFGAVLRHQAAGYTANGMSGWNVPAAAVDRVGALIAASPQVSHCYERSPLPGWPYNLYGMIHGASRDECVATAARLAQETGIRDYQILFSLREFKKTSMVYLEG